MAVPGAIYARWHVSSLSEEGTCLGALGLRLALNASDLHHTLQRSVNISSKQLRLEYLSSAMVNSGTMQQPPD